MKNARNQVSTHGSCYKTGDNHLTNDYNHFLSPVTTISTMGVVGLGANNDDYLWCEWRVTSQVRVCCTVKLHTQ